MKVELSERSQRVVEGLIEDGTFPTVEAAVEAAIDALDSEWDGLDVAELSEQAQHSRTTGTFREANETYLAEVRSKAQQIIDSKQSR